MSDRDELFAELDCADLARKLEESVRNDLDEATKTGDGSLIRMALEGEGEGLRFYLSLWVAWQLGQGDIGTRLVALLVAEVLRDGKFRRLKPPHRLREGALQKLLTNLELGQEILDMEKKVGSTDLAVKRIGRKRGFGKTRMYEAWSVYNQTLSCMRDGSSPSERAHWGRIRDDQRGRLLPEPLRRARWNRDQEQTPLRPGCS